MFYPKFQYKGNEFPSEQNVVLECHLLRERHVYLKLWDSVKAIILIIVLFHSLSGILGVSLENLETLLPCESLVYLGGKLSLGFLGERWRPGERILWVIFPSV